MPHILDAPLFEIARGLRDGTTSAGELLEECLRRHREQDPPLGAYKLLDEVGARAAARLADEALASGPASPLTGLPVSVKDLYGMDGHPTFAGTARPLPEAWARDGWLVGRLREGGAVFVGKTHTVEMAYGAVGLNPHWGAPRNPRDEEIHRIPGGSSSGAGVSLLEGSAVVALGSDTGGSVRIPASVTGTVGLKTTEARWPTDGVVPLSHTLDTLGALTRTVEDSLYFFGSVDPAWGDPVVLRRHLARRIEALEPLRVGMPAGRIWDACQEDIARVLREVLEAGGSRWRLTEVDGTLLDRAADLYLTGGIGGAECRAFLRRELPEWLDILHPIVADRLRDAPEEGSKVHVDALRKRAELMEECEVLFADADVLALPGHVLTPPPVTEVQDLADYRAVNARLLGPTCAANVLGLCALTLPVGFDDEGMPVGLQLVAPGGREELLLGAAWIVEGAA